MAWYSILPSNLLYVENWAARTFLILGIITIFPWAALIIFDLLLYLWRMLAYEVPVIGGRARGTGRRRRRRRSGPGPRVLEEVEVQRVFRTGTGTGVKEG